MYPFERYMKVLKGYVRNRNRAEGSIAEGYIVEEAIEFCTKFCQDNMSIGLGKAKERDQNDDIGRPSSAASHIRPEKEQLMQAHLYVLENTNDVQPYIEYVDFKYLLYLFIYYVVPIRIYLTIVATELESPKNTISNTLRWISHGPSPSVITYFSYVMNGIRYNTEHRGGVRNVQNSSVCLVANTIQISSAKDKHPIVTNMSFYDPSDSQWHVVLNPPNREYKDLINDDELGDTSLNCISSNNVPMNVFEEINDEDDPNYVRTDCDVGVDDDVAQVDCFLETSSQRSMRGPTTMIHLTQISSDANRLVVDYNERGEWIGENATQMKRSNMQKERRKNYKYNDRTSRKDYANLEEELVSLYYYAQYYPMFIKFNDKLQKDIDKTYSVSDDILTQALGTPEHRGRVRGVGRLITPSFYFHKHIPSEPRETHITVDVDANWKKEKSQILSEYSQMAKQMLKNCLRKNKYGRNSLWSRLGEGDVRVLIELACDSHSLLPIPVVGSIYSVHDAIGSHVPWRKYLIAIEEQKKTSSKKCRELEALKGTKSKMNELKLPLTIRFVLKHVEKDMKDEYLTIPVDTQELLGYSFNVNVMKDSIKQLCLMEELTLSVILSYMICLYESDPSIVEEYAFMNPGQILKVYALDSLRHGSVRDELKSMVNTGLRMFYAETNTRARPLTWVSFKCAQQPGSTECGYYVMKFMQDIVRQKSITITDVFFQFVGPRFSVLVGPGLWKPGYPPLLSLFA
ncbi:uncharacterized protein E6C27_scaffold352G00380 [Cucumis melo var. makuwa]|uniref:DUF4218 domain-containing protein n=1 Tax=Cucumis melo var. makuwa TaxID=1194695 RepID=A0A5A7VPW2_CUCMM|nr:uncharacterized protein E6C27_scaffold352G00380 [Cucumis melo var. makuwa]